MNLKLVIPSSEIVTNKVNEIGEEQNS